MFGVVEWHYNCTLKGRLDDRLRVPPGAWSMPKAS